MAHRESRRRFLRNALQYLQETTNREDLQRLLTEEEAWDAFTAEAGLSGDEEVALHQALSELIELIPEEDRDTLQRRLEDRRTFLEAFPQLKSEFRKNISKLRRLADHMDEVHRGCTISNVVVSSTSTVSGVLSMLGVSLAPVTAGGSLALSAAALGLGTVASVTNTATLLVEEKSRRSDEEEARRLVTISVNLMKEAKILTKVTFRVLKTPVDVFRNLKNLRQHFRAFKMAKANSRLVADAKMLMTTGATRNVRQVEKAFEGTALAMTKKIRIRNAAISGVFLALDVYNLVTDSMHLYDGAKSESAAELRSLALKLEEELKKLERIYAALTSHPPQ